MESFERISRVISSFPPRLENVADSRASLSTSDNGRLPLAASTSNSLISNVSSLAAFASNLTLCFVFEITEEETKGSRKSSVKLPSPSRNFEARWTNCEWNNRNSLRSVELGRGGHVFESVHQSAVFFV